MKVTFVLPHAGISGGIRVVAIYADRLQKRGHSVSVVSLPPKAPGVLRSMKSLLLGRGWPSRARGSSFFENGHVAHRTIDRIRPITDDDIPDSDVVVATWWETAEWVSRLGARKGKHAYLIQGHEVFPGLPADRVRLTYSLPMRKIVVSRWLQEILHHEYDQSIVTLIENGVDSNHFSAPPRNKNATPTIGFLYSASSMKRADVAFEAVRLARLQVPNLRVVSFGSEHLDDALRLAGGVEFFLRPRQSRIPAIYSGCDAWLFTSESEGFGLPILEAMACRTPVIASSAGAAPELIGTECGYIVPLSAQAFAEKIVEVALMPDKGWRSMSEAARREAERRSWEAAASRLEATFLAIAGADN